MIMKRAVKNKVKKLFPSFFTFRRLLMRYIERSDRELHKVISDRQMSHPNPLARYGKKCFSQTDEDGITLEILRRLNLSNGVFAEFGVGDGTENNTLILMALGWKGFWVGGESLAFSHAKSARLSFNKTWVTRENIYNIYMEGCIRIGAKNVDLVSLDLDGNDLYFCEELLENGVKPSLFIVEYNAKFPPPIKFSIDYDPKHTWLCDDYQGASLSSFTELFKKFGYFLVCCNAATGSNAFFVRTEFNEKFSDVPKNEGEIYVAPHYYLFNKYGHRGSIKTIEKIVNR